MLPFPRTARWRMAPSASATIVAWKPGGNRRPSASSAGATAAVKAAAPTHPTTRIKPPIYKSDNVDLPLDIFHLSKKALHVRKVAYSSQQIFSIHYHLPEYSFVSVFDGA